MPMFTLRHTRLWLLALLVLAAWYFTPSNHHAESTITQQDVTQPGASLGPHAGIWENLASSQQPARTQTQSPQTPTIIEPIDEEIKIPMESEELVRWRLDRGYPDDSNPYDSYDETTLKALVDAGDIRAMHTLANIYAQAGNLSDSDREAIADLYRKAALYGSTFAFLHLGVQQESAYANLSTDDPKRHATALEILATYNVAALRGDRMPNIARGNHFVEQNNIQLSEEDRQYIDSRSHEIYTNLSKHRYALALDEFDNEVPDAVQQYFSDVESIQKKIKLKSQHQQANE